MKVAIRALTRADRAAFVELTSQRPNYTRELAEKRTDLVFHIAFANPTSDGQPTYFVGTQGDHLVCHLGRMPTRFYFDGKPHLASFAHDLFAHPDLQAKGAGFFVAMKLYKAVEEACASFCGLVWTNDINIKFQQARKYEQLWALRWARPLDGERLVTKVLEKFHLAHPPELVTRVVRTAARVGVVGVDHVLAALLARTPIKTIGVADERFDALAARVGPLLGTAPVKDRAYVQWKYFDWPGLETTVHITEAPDGSLRGFSVLREPLAPTDPGRMLDLVADPADGPALSALIAAAIRHFRERGLNRIECMATFPPIEQALSRFLFARRQPATPLFFLNGNKSPNIELLRRIDHWCHAYGDSEGGEVP